MRPSLFRSPDCRASAPATILANVDLPAPFTPSSPMRSSTSSRRLRSRRTAFPSYPTLAPSSCSSGGASGRGGDGLELCQAFHSRLCLGGLAGLGAKSVDEGLQMGALGLLLGAGGRLQSRLFRAPLLEVVVTSGVKIELAFAQVQDGIDRIVQKLAVMADDQG